MLRDVLYRGQEDHKDEEWNHQNLPPSRPAQEASRRWERLVSAAPSKRPVPADRNVKEDWERDPPSFADMYIFDDVRLLLAMLPTDVSPPDLRLLHEVLELGSIVQRGGHRTYSELKVGQRYQSSVSVHNAGAMDWRNGPISHIARLAELKLQRDAARARMAAAATAKRARENDADEADDDDDDDIKGLDDDEDDDGDEEELRPVDSEEVRQARRARENAVKRYQKWRRDNAGNREPYDFYGSGSGSGSSGGTSGKASGARHHDAFMDYLNSPLALTAAQP